jgi:hypothetical protein
MRNAGTAFAFLIVAGFITTVIAMQWYPAILVRTSDTSGGRAHILWEFQITRVADSALTYYKKALENTSSTLQITTSVRSDAYEKSASTLIENILVHDAVFAGGLEAATEALIAKKVDEYAAQPDFSIAVSLVYGLDNSGFIELIAQPEAEREILKEQNKWDDAALAVWITEEIKASRIVRFSK